MEVSEVVNEKKTSNPVKNISKFFNELKAELKRITWPTRSQLISNTVAVLISCVLVGAFIAVVDAILAKVLELFITR